MKGLTNKIKTLKREAYGFLDLELFKLIILGIHEAKYAWTGQPCFFGLNLLLSLGGLTTVLLQMDLVA
jgi:hypothetical protein